MPRWRGIAFPAILLLALPVTLLLVPPVSRWVVLSDLRKLDRSASIRGVALSPRAVRLDSVDLPSLGFRAPRVWVLLEGGLLSWRCTRIVVPACVLTDPSLRRRPGAGGGGRGGLPGLGMDEAVLVTADDTSMASCWVADGGRAFCGLASGDWGSVSVSGTSAGGARTSVQAVFRDCTALPGGLLRCPASLAGHSFTGRLSGSLASDSASLSGMLDSLDGAPAGIAFELDGSWGGEMSLEARTDLSSIEPVLSAWMRHLDPDAFVALSPRGSAALHFSEGSACTYGVDADFPGSRIYSRLLAPDTLTFDASAEVYGEAGSGGFTIDSGTVSIGGISLCVRLEASAGALRLRAWNPSIPGETITASIPGPMQGRLEGTVLRGSLGVSLDLFVDRACPESSDVSISVDASSLSVGRCPVDVRGFRTAGSCVMHDSWGNSRRIDLDPRTNPAFLPLDSMPQEFEAMLCCAEDGEFRLHSGFSPEHIRSSLVADLSSGRFSRGASTITMQLARNLFLSREKTLSRKLQEVFLTWMLEESLSKDRILELYANVVELGPDVFGFQEASGYYFGCRMQDLSARRIAYLVSLLPGPRAYHSFFERGSVPGYWEDYLDVLIRGASRRGALTPAEEDGALSERISFPGASAGARAAPSVLL